jgi:hypothetical protein
MKTKPWHYSVAFGIACLLIEGMVLFYGLPLFSVGAIALIFIIGIAVLYRSQSSLYAMLADGSQKLEKETSRVEKLLRFNETLSNNDFSQPLVPESKDDKLTHTLIAMRDKLKGNVEEEKKRHWATSGLAQLGEILRADHRTIDELYDKIIRFIVGYTDSNQGGLFIVNKESKEEFLELKAMYAWDKKKYVNKRIERGEGLTGQAWMEGDSIFMTVIPKNYIKITSGLGHALPNSLFLVPLKINDETHGVLEIASLSIYEPHQREFLERLAQTLASTIATAKTNEHTRELLEQSQQLGEQLKAQEEEIRQSMEEMTATQEEMSRKENEYISQLNAQQEEVTKYKKLALHSNGNGKHATEDIHHYKMELAV